MGCMAGMLMARYEGMSGYRCWTDNMACVSEDLEHWRDESVSVLGCLSRASGYTTASTLGHSYTTPYWITKTGWYPSVIA